MLLLMERARVISKHGRERDVLLNYKHKLQQTNILVHINQKNSRLLTMPEMHHHSAAVEVDAVEIASKFDSDLRSSGASISKSQQ
jgi:hypothetical protein